MLTDSGEVTKFIISSQPIVEQEEDDTVQVQYSFLQQDFPSRDELLDKTIQHNLGNIAGGIKLGTEEGNKTPWKTFFDVLRHSVHMPGK